MRIASQHIMHAHCAHLSQKEYHRRPADQPLPTLAELNAEPRGWITTNPPFELSAAE
eukprot:gene276-1471_t